MKNEKANNMFEDLDEEEVVIVEGGVGPFALNNCIIRTGVRVGVSIMQRIFG